MSQKRKKKRRRRTEAGMVVTASYSSHYFTFRPTVYFYTFLAKLKDLKLDRHVLEASVESLAFEHMEKDRISCGLLRWSRPLSLKSLFHLSLSLWCVSLSLSLVLATWRTYSHLYSLSSCRNRVRGCGHGFFLFCCHSSLASVPSFTPQSLELCSLQFRLSLF